MADDVEIAGHKIPVLVVAGAGGLLLGVLVLLSKGSSQGKGTSNASPSAQNQHAGSADAAALSTIEWQLANLNQGTAGTGASDQIAALQQQEQADVNNIYWTLQNEAGLATVGHPMVQASLKRSGIYAPHLPYPQPPSTH